MSCGCGDECCDERGPLASVTGLALLGARRNPAGLGFLDLESGGGDYNDYWGDAWEGDWYSGGGWGGYTGSDMWGFGNSYWGDEGWLNDLTQPEYAYLCATYGGCDYIDPNSSTFGFFDAEPGRRPGFLPASAPNVPLVPYTPNWWEYFLPNFGGGGGTKPNPPALPPYCPGGTYHPASDPFSCVPFPDDPNAGQRPAPRTRPSAQQQPKPTAPKVSPQNPQPCPAPGITNPATGKCVCPKGLIYDANKKQCVEATLSNRLVAPVGETDIPLWVWIVGGIVVGKALSGGKTVVLSK